PSETLARRLVRPVARPSGAEHVLGHRGEQLVPVACPPVDRVGGETGTVRHGTYRHGVEAVGVGQSHRRPDQLLPTGGAVPVRSARTSPRRRGAAPVPAAAVRACLAAARAVTPW